jgi:chemotaxis protein methyltransferase CheR
MSLNQDYGFSPDSFYPLSDELYRLITNLIYKISGLRFDESSKYLIQRRLSQRIQALKLDSFQKYYYYLLYDQNKEAEYDNIFDIITVNETYFFREEKQLKAFSEEILPELISEKEKQNIKTIRIWSAGCSTGEESYTIAMIMDQQKYLKGWHIDIFASDISPKTIMKARKAIYTANSFRGVPEEIIKTYFIKENDKYRLVDSIKNMVTFGKLNILEEKKLVLLGEMDVIFCRNVLIYFDVEAKKKAISNFYNRLRKNGFLLLGHSESLLGLSTQFKLRHFINDMVYQK